MKKEAYFQGGGGVNEPTPKKKKYKSEPKLVDQPRFKEPFFRNYDLYETEGVDGKAEHGPGAGLYQHMSDYKSVADFLKKKRERNSDKYKADDSVQEDDGKINKTKSARRKALLAHFIKNAIDFPVDDQISNPILGESGAYSDSVPIGGMLDEYLSLDDFEGKSPDKLDFGRDYTEYTEPKKPVDIESIINKFLTPQENGLYGLPDGISPPSDLDADVTISNRDSAYGTTDSGNTLYDKMWI
jgi:hypothetical protein